MKNRCGKRPIAERPVVLGVTGNIACGKSTVMRILGDLGAELIDADAVYHELIAPGLPLWRALRDRFGDRILASDLTIDRKALGGIVFSDPAALAELDRLTHPAVTVAIEARIGRSRGSAVAVAAVKLIESGAAERYSSIWLVTCDPAQQIERLIARNGLARDDAERRVAAQPPLEPKLAFADEVIDNSGAIAATREQVVAAWERLQIPVA